MKRRTILLAAGVVLASVSSAHAGFLIGSPDMAPTAVGAAGALQEDWGIVEVRVLEPAAKFQVTQTAVTDPVPTVTTRKQIGSLAITETVYRAPVMPAGADVLLIDAVNSGAEPLNVRLQLTLPDSVSTGETVGTIGGRAVFAIFDAPKVARQMKPWGCSGGTALPGWATPQGPCDPAFANIRAGMGGIPVEYRFAVPDGQPRFVVLGLCESFWGNAGQRPVDAGVEGAELRVCDPLAEWGRHVPGCLKFAAADTDGDGYITVRVSPHPGAVDSNPILNVVWVFTQDVDAEQVKLGALNDRAERYVDVGGPNDQDLYEGGPLTLEWTAAPGETKSMTFALAAPGGVVPVPGQTSWTLDSMKAAADRVWASLWAQAKPGLPKDKRQELAQAVLARTQVKGFFLSLVPGTMTYSAAGVAASTAALDDAGLYGQAERVLRVYYEPDAPDQLKEAAKPGDYAARAHVLFALARHAEVSGDKPFAAAAWPAMKQLAESLDTQPVPADAQAVAADALKRAVAAGRLAGAPDVAAVEALAQKIAM